MAANLRGVIAAFLAPFDQQQALDKASLCRLVQFNIQQGIDGLYTSGSTGGAFVQNLSKRGQILEIAAEEAKDEIKPTAHIGYISTAESQQPTASAKRYGFDTASAIAPLYYPFNFEKHYDHYRTIINSAGGSPMVVYNIPALSGIELTLDRTNTLIMLFGASALRQTSGDLYQMERTRRERPDLMLYNGYDGVFASGLLADADGGIGSTYDIMGWRYQGIVKALKGGDIQTARKLQTEYNKVINLLIKTGVFRDLGTVLCYMNVASMPLCRKPLDLVDERYLPELKAPAQQLV